MGKQQVHVVPSGDGWTNELGGAPIGNYSTKDEAIRAGRDLAKALQTELVIHNQDGKIYQKNSYGPDPYPPRG